VCDYRRTDEVSVKGCGHVNFEGPGYGIWPEPSRFGEPLGIRRHLKKEIAAFESAARPSLRELKRHRHAGDRPVVLIGYLNYRVAACPLPRIVDRALAFDYREVHSGGSGRLTQRLFRLIVRSTLSGVQQPD